MSHPRTRDLRSGTAPATWHRHGVIALLLIVVLVLSACSTNVPPTEAGPGLTLAAFEAEDAVISESVMVVRSEPGTSGGRVLVQPESIQSAGTVREDAYLTFTVDSDGDRYLWARVMGRSDSEDAVYAGLNGRLQRIVPAVHGEYVWAPVTSEYLEAGEHVISLGHAEPETSVDALIVTNRADLTVEELNIWLLSDLLPAMPDPTEPADSATDTKP